MSISRATLKSYIHIKCPMTGDGSIYNPQVLKNTKGGSLSTPCPSTHGLIRPGPCYSLAENWVIVATRLPAVVGAT